MRVPNFTKRIRALSIEASETPTTKDENSDFEKIYFDLFLLKRVPWASKKS